MTFEHTIGGNPSRRANRAVLMVYGESELAVLAELQRQYPAYENIVILKVKVL